MIRYRQSQMIIDKEGKMRQYLRSLVCHLFTILIVSTAMAQNGAGDGKDSPKRLNSLAKGGYSIFHETMADMTWQEVEKAAQKGAVVLLAGAVIEEHGPHMVNGIDTYLGYMTCKIIRRELEPTQLTVQTIGKWVQDVRGTTPLGYVGDPASYDAKEARIFWDATCKMAADAIEAYVKKE